MKRKDITKEQLEYLYFEQKMSTVDLAKFFKTSRNTLRQLFKEYGLKARTNSESLKGRKLSPGHAKKSREHLKKFQIKGEKNSSWKGGEILTKKGYKMLYMPEHPNSEPNGYIREHRLVMANHIGRVLTEDEHIHHRNRIKTDNRIENLELMSNSEHHIEHWSESDYRKEMSEKRRKAKQKWWDELSDKDIEKVRKNMSKAMKKAYRKNY